MLIPIRCFTCGKVLADKFDWYTKQAEEAKASGPGPGSKKANNAEDSPTPYFDTNKTGKILDMMGLTRYCCRRHMLTTVDMMDTI